MRGPRTCWESPRCERWEPRAGMSHLRSKSAADWKRFLVDHLLPAQLYFGNCEGGMAYDPMRMRIFEHPIDLFGRQARVQRHGDYAEHAAGIYEFDVVGPVR